VAQQPEVTQGATPPPDLSQGVAQPGLAQGAAQQPVLSQQVAQEEPGITQAGGNNPIGYPNYAGSYPTAQDGAGNGTYVVQPGDTLSQIAAGLGVTTDYLASQDGITDPNLIYSGQPLYYLVGSGDQGTADDAATHDLVGDNTVVDEGVVETGE